MIGQIFSKNLSQNQRFCGETELFRLTYSIIAWGDNVSVKDAVAKRFEGLCAERGIKINELATISGVTPSTAYSMLDERRRDISIITIKKFCDGLDITLSEFFTSSEFDSLEQEIC